MARRRTLSEREISGLMRGAWKLYKRGKQNEAWGMFQRVIKSDPFHPGAWYGIGKIWFQRGRYRDAKTCFRKAWLLGKRWYFLFDYGRACVRMRWFSEAQKVYRVLATFYGERRALLFQEWWERESFGLSKGASVVEENAGIPLLLSCVA